VKRISSKAIAALTNLALVLIVCAIAVVCFLPKAEETSKLSDRVYYKGNAKSGVSLAINVYWGTEELRSILDILELYEAKATFFLGGSWADDNIAVVKEIAARGHEIGSHGFFHKDHDKLSYAQNFDEIKTSIDLLSGASGKTVTLFAPPSGAYNEATVNAAEALNLKTIMWSKDTIDWRDKDESLCLRRATEGVQGGDIVLMHPMAHTVKALPKILEKYKELGLKPITVSENIASDEG